MNAPARERLPTTRAEAEKAKASHRLFAEVHAEVVAVDLAKDPEELKSPGRDTSTAGTLSSVAMGTTSKP